MPDTKQDQPKQLSSNYLAGVIGIMALNQCWYSSLPWYGNLTAALIGSAMAQGIIWMIEKARNNRKRIWEAIKSRSVNAAKTIREFRKECDNEDPRASWIAMMDKSVGRSLLTVLFLAVLINHTTGRHQRWQVNLITAIISVLFWNTIFWGMRKTRFYQPKPKKYGLPQAVPDMGDGRTGHR